MRASPEMQGELPGGRSFTLLPGSPSFGEERIRITDPDGSLEEVALHDYDRVYAIPGLYEAVVQDSLDCLSPRMTGEHAAAVVREAGLQPGDMRVLDVGAGNGVVGEELAEHGFTKIFGTDLLTSAESATRRDRPGTYERYVAGDLAEAEGSLLGEIEAWQPTMMTCAGALGGGHMSAVALGNALDALAEPGFSVITLGENRIDETAGEGFGAMLAERIASGRIEELSRERFRHRLSMAGEPVYYLVLALRATS